MTLTHGGEWMVVIQEESGNLDQFYDLETPNFWAADSSTAHLKCTPIAGLPLDPIDWLTQ